MSVYSGFATRQQETFYDKLLLKTLQLLSARIFQVYRCNLTFDEIKWAKQLRKVSNYMILMDRNKWLEPKFSEALSPLAMFLKEVFTNELQNDTDKLSSLNTDISAIVDAKSEMSVRITSNKSQQHHQHSPNLHTLKHNESPSPSKDFKITQSQESMDRGRNNGLAYHKTEAKALLQSNDFQNGDNLSTQDKSLPKIVPLNTFLMPTQG